MDQDNRRMVGLYKRLIIAALAVALIVPWVLSISALAKINRLQSQLTEAMSRLEQSDAAITDAALLSGSGSPGDRSSDSPARSGAGTVYLTFDDGPSARTEEILEVLQHYGVKATFFVVGHTDRHSTQMYCAILQQGHSLGLHSYTHDYQQIYASADACLQDIGRLDRLIFSYTGLHSRLYRFPGGSSNDFADHGLLSQVVTRLAEQGIVYFDWNVSAGDASASPPTAEQIVSNVVDGVRGKRQAIVLLHDAAGKSNTVQALPMIIEQLQAAGFQFEQITVDTPPVQQLVLGIAQS